MLFFACLLAFFWGCAWAAFLQFVPFGRWLVRQRTWITVVVGVGVDLLLARMVVPWEYWWPAVLIVCLSALGIVARSLANEAGEWEELLRVLRGRCNGHEEGRE